MSCPPEFSNQHVTLSTTFANHQFFEQHLPKNWDLKHFATWKGYELPLPTNTNSKALLKEYRSSLNALLKKKILHYDLQTYLGQLQRKAGQPDKVLRDLQQQSTTTMTINAENVVNGNNYGTVSKTVSSTAQPSSSKPQQQQQEEQHQAAAAALPQQQQQQQQEPEQQQQQQQEYEQQQQERPQQQQQQQHQQPQQQKIQQQEATTSRVNLKRGYTTDDYDEASLQVSGLSIKYPNAQGRFYVDDNDITWDLYNFQRMTLKKTTTSNLSFESHVHHILSLSSILLVSPGRMHKDVRQVFGDDTLASLESYLLARFGVDDYEFSMTLDLKVTSIIKKTTNRKMDRDDATMALLSLKSEANDREFKVIKCIKSMVELLPNDVVNDEVGEVELFSRYLNAFLIPLFDDPKNGVLFRWHDSMNSEANKTAATISRRRPDSSIAVLDGCYIDYSRGFGEVKSQSHANNPSSVGKDLVRLGVFAKNSIDVNNMKAVLTFQAVGRNVTFYIMELMGDGVYVMYEVGHFHVPGSIGQILQLIGYFDKLYFLLNAFDKHCVQLDPERANKRKQMKRATLLTPDCNRITEKSANNKRQSITKHTY